MASNSAWNCVMVPESEMDNYEWHRDPWWEQYVEYSSKIEKGVMT